MTTAEKTMDKGTIHQRACTACKMLMGDAHGGQDSRTYGCAIATITTI